MSNSIIRQEEKRTVLGVDCRAMNVVATDKGQLLNQKVIATRYFDEAGHKYMLAVELSFDDECKNGHSSFAITGDITEHVNGRRLAVAAGCVHEEIAKVFPEFKPLIPWHLCSTDGPLHYEANTLYRAGDRDCWGKKKGEPLSFSHRIGFGDQPNLSRNISEGMAQFLEEIIKDPKRYSAISYREIPHPTEPKVYGSKFTLNGLSHEWHSCPFDTEKEAKEFVEAFAFHIPNNAVSIKKTPLTYSEGKERELDKARDAAIWPDATDEELSQEPEILCVTLRARLPKLLEDFRAAMHSVGFVGVDGPVIQDAVSAPSL